MSRRALALGSAAALALLAGCDDKELDLTVDNLAPVGPEFRYAAWVLDDDGDLDLAGTFDVDSDGTTILYDESDVDERLETDVDRDNAEAFLITLERITGFNLPGVNDNDFAEELEDELEDFDRLAEVGPVLIAGEFGGARTATLTTRHPLALDSDFADIAGSYLVVSPSNDDATDDDQGIWWMNEDFDEATLVLPVLPDGWIYENWLVDGDGDIVSLGRFSDPADADDDGAGPLAGAGAVPSFPGQDFVDDGVSLIGLSTFTTIEPVDDPRPNVPSGYIILEDDEITDVGALTLQTMTNVSSTDLPTAVVRYRDND